MLWRHVAAEAFKIGDRTFSPPVRNLKTILRARVCSALKKTKYQGFMFSHHLYQPL
jgi:hypothetical protein